MAKISLPKCLARTFTKAHCNDRGSGCNIRRIASHNPKRISEGKVMESFINHPATNNGDEYSVNWIIIFIVAVFIFLPHEKIQKTGKKAAFLFLGLRELFLESKKIYIW